MSTTSLIDVDNTLLDNDAAKVEIARSLRNLLGEAGEARFWAAYEAIRVELGVVDIPRTIGRALEGWAGMELRQSLAGMFMLFPFGDYIYKDATRMIRHLERMGPVVILSDGDPVFQPIKVYRSGLAAAVDGRVLVYPHKEEHLPEIAAAFPAERYLLIDDKPGVIERVTARVHELGGQLETVLVRQGKYAAAVPSGKWSGATHTVDSLSEVIGLIK